MKDASLQTASRTTDDRKLRWSFHGTKAVNIKKIATFGLLNIGHPLNPSKSTDPGYFGAPTHGVYVSRYVDYVLKYSNDLDPLEPGESVKICMHIHRSGWVRVICGMIDGWVSMNV